MSTQLGAIALIVADYDPAIDWFRRCLRFTLREDTPMGGKRWVVMAPPGGGCTILLARAADSTQAAAIGQQGAGRVWLFLETDDFAATHAYMLAQGVVFEEEPRYEPYGVVAVFRDICGNRWDLLERKDMADKGAGKDKDGQR